MNRINRSPALARKPSLGELERVDSLQARLPVRVGKVSTRKRYPVVVLALFSTLLAICIIYIGSLWVITLVPTDQNGELQFLPDDNWLNIRLSGGTGHDRSCE